MTDSNGHSSEGATNVPEDPNAQPDIGTLDYDQDALHLENHGPPGVFLKGPGVDPLDDYDSSADGRDLKRSVTRGLSFSLLNTVVGRAGTFISGLVLARLLTPEDYGSFAIALVVLAGLLSINELSTHTALVHWQKDPRQAAPTVLTITLVVSFALVAITWLVAPVLASVLGSPDVSGLIRALSVLVLFDAFTCVPAAGLARDFEQGRRFAIDFAMFVVSTTTTVVLAFLGFGAASLVIGRLLSGALGVVLLQTLGRLRCWPGWDSDVARQLLSFGLPLAGTSLLEFAMANAALAIVGVSLGPTEMGLFLLASNLAMWPANIVAPTIGRVTFAWFSRLDTGSRGRGQALTKAFPLVLAVALPTSIGLSLLAEPIVVVLYGETWRSAASALQYLAIGVGATVLIDLCQAFLASDNRGRWVILIQITWLAILLPALYFATAQWGATGAAAATALVAVVAALPAYLALAVSRGADLRGLGRSAARPLVGAAALILVTTLITLTLTSEVVLLLVGVALGALAYLTITWPLIKGALATIRS